MENTSETIQRQIDELSALKAIFSNDLRDLRHSSRDNDKNRCPIEVEITLKPMVSMSELNKEVYVQLDLCVKCGKKYPNVIPDEISLKNVKGLSALVCDQLRAQLYELAKSLRGEVMIFEFTDHVRQYLHKHNRPPLKSFYDEMLSRENKLELQKTLEMEKKMETIRIREEMKRKHLEEELQRKQMALQEESRMRRESREDITSICGSLSETKSSVKCSLNHETCCIRFLVNGIERKIQRGKCLFHNHLRQSIEYLGLDLISGEPFLIIEWILNINQLKQNTLLEFQLINDDKSVDEIVNRISKIETFFRSKMKSLEHSNLVRYLSMRYSKESDYIVIDILQEYIHGNSLFSLANVLRGQSLDMGLIRYYSKQILEALNYLHKHQCPHADLKETNVYIDSITRELKISGYYLEKQIYDLLCDINCDQSSPYNSNLFNINIHRLMMKDIFQFGLLVNAMSNDWNFINDSKYLHFNTKVNKQNLDNDFKNFLEKCIDPEENARWSPEMLLQHPFILSQKTSTTLSTLKKDYELKLCPISNSKQDQSDDYEKINDSKVLLSSIVSSGVHSRLANEFEVLDELGKGGFGYVYKVKNILDGRCYALKKISLNPSNHSLYQKIKREVNLLSRLNHENVVRYFCSWIETESDAAQSDEELSSSGKASDTLTQVSVKKESDSKKPNNKSTSDSSISESSSIEDVDYEAEEDIFGTSFLVQIPHKVSNSSDDQYVIFEGSGYICADESTTNSGHNNSTEEKGVKIPRQYMYIQMELCEKSTLRDAIDSGLHNETHRKRRLFREIVEGLVHIHQQGMIHRDLKPGNIFLDLNDHVKIGDFGLAKEIYLIKDENFVSSSIDPQLNPIHESDRLTGKIGTPFYVAPELTVNPDINSNKIFYTQKVDIYSLGIIFFEMSYPFQTSMERTKVIMALRKPEIYLPNDVSQHLTEMDIQLFKSLVQHDYSLRPSSSQLLASEYLPAPEMEEKEEQNVIRRAVQNPRTKIHKYMLNILFQKEISEIEDYVYDVNDEHLGNRVRVKSDLFIFSMKQRVFQYVYSTLQAIMQSHCAVSLSLPTLIPKRSTRKYEGNDVFYVMDHNGSIVSLPHDLRVPFARYIARNRICHFRRYSIEKVYRQRRVLAYHPRELWECAFDIVTSKHPNSCQIMPDTEVLSVLCHVIQQFPMLQGFGLTLKVNHIKLVKAVLNYCDVPEEQHDRAIRLISECNLVKLVQNKESNDSSSANSTLAYKIISQRKKILETLIDETKVNLLLQLIELEQDSVKKLLSNVKTHMRKKGVKQQNALEMAKKALKELELILFNAERLGNLNKFSIKISPSFVSSSSTIYSGMIFQLEREIKYKNSTQRQFSSVIAVGGRYDDLVSHFDVMSKKNDKLVEPKGAVGISIEFEKIMKCVLDEEFKTKTIFGDIIDVVVCSLMTQSSDIALKELCAITKEFWSSGLKVFCFPEDLPKNIDDLHTFCLETSVRYAIVLKDNSDSTLPNFHQMTAKLFAYEKERFINKNSGNVSDIVEYVIRSIASLKSELNNNSTVTHVDQGVVVRSDSNKFINNQSNDANYSTVSAIASNIRVSFITAERLQSAQKRRLESNIISHLSTALNFIMNNAIIEVLAVDLPFKVIKTIAGEIEFDGENDTKNTFEKSKLSVMDKHPRYRRHIAQIMDEVFTYKVDKKCSVLIIISTIDNMKFKILS